MLRGNSYVSRAQPSLAVSIRGMNYLSIEPHVFLFFFNIHYENNHQIKTSDRSNIHRNDLLTYMFDISI